MLVGDSSCIPSCSGSWLLAGMEPRHLQSRNLTMVPALRLMAGHLWHLAHARLSFSSDLIVGG